MANKNNLKILFVCLGNSCRSPMAESILKNMIQSNKDILWEIDSAALRDWNVGCAPENRCIQVLQEHNLTSEHIARRIQEEDFYRFDYVFGMDDYNVEELLSAAPSNSSAKIELFGVYAENKNDQIILDPYFETGIHGFRRCFEQINLMCKNFIDSQLHNKA